jgi:outer membrane protein assembly factor BamB
VEETNLIVLGVRGNVVALDKSNGTEVWRTKLAGFDFVNVVVEGPRVYAGTRGKIFCLSRTSGEILWKNELKGLGLGLVTIGLPGSPTAAMAEKIRRDQATAAVAAAGATS